MKILVLAPSMVSAGGIQRYTWTLLRALKELMGEENVRFLSMPEVFSSNGSSFLSTRSKLNFGSLAVREAARCNPDLVVCSHLGLGPLGWLISKTNDCPYWVVAHGIEAWVALPRAKRAALRQAARVIAISEFTCEQVTKRQGVEAERMVRLPYALNEALTSADPAISGPARSIREGQPVILTVARIAASEQYKGHDLVIRALPSVLLQVPNLAYVVVGEGDDQARIEALATTLGVRQNVIFTGRVSDSELAALYHRSNVFAMPARTVLADQNAKGEGFGIVFLEAMAFGKPVIGPQSGAPAEFIHHGKHGLLVDPEDSAALAEALIYLLTNPCKAREMGKAGHDWVQKQYSYSSFREKLNAILHDSVRTSCTQRIR
jgi:phosphatidyl-myo-inositol dimannoside synthase